MSIKIMFGLAASLMAVAAQAQPTPGTPISDKLAKALAGRTAGPPVSCITLRDNVSSTVIDRNAVIYKQNSRTWFVNFPEGGHCGLLRPDSILLTRVPIGRLCSGDISRVIDRTSRIEFGSCTLGEFVPYTRPKR